MRSSWKAMLMGLAMAAALVSSPGLSRAQTCGDVNNDGNTNVIDAVILAQCLAQGGTCPAVNPGPLCNTGSLADCGDIFEDGDTSTIAGLTADLAALVNTLAGLDTLFGACNGPGPDSCNGGNLVVPTSSITSNTTWGGAGCKVTLNGTVTVSNPAFNPNNVGAAVDPVVLTIEPGTVVMGAKNAVDPAALIFERGTKIDAQGTKTNPIYFTSDQAPGTRGQGDWGGVVFNGRSTVNGPGCTFQGEGLPTDFGGCIENDSSGIASFVHIEFAGINFTPNNELNAWTMNGIGSQTQFNFLQAHAGNDDCFEWFGGTSNHHNMVASACGDDGFDLQLGFTGSVQHGVMFQDGTLTDPGRDSRGIEADNSEFDNDASPRSNPDFCNMTLVGGEHQAGANDGSDAGMMLRRGLTAQIANAITIGYGDCGVELRDTATSREACVDANDDGTPESLTGNLIVRNSVFYNNGSGGTEQSKSGGTLVDPCTPGPDFDPDCNCDTPDWYALLVAGFDVENPDGSNAVDPGISETYPGLDATQNAACTAVSTPWTCCTGSGTGVCREMPDVRPAAIADPPPFACSTINPIFSDESYLGGIDPGAGCTTAGATAECDWMSKPWIDFNRN